MLFRVNAHGHRSIAIAIAIVYGKTKNSPEISVGLNISASDIYCWLDYKLKIASTLFVHRSNLVLVSNWFRFKLSRHQMPCVCVCDFMTGNAIIKCVSLNNHVV